MLHTKTTDSSATYNWKERCKDTKNAKNCPVGIAWPLVAGGRDETDKSSAVNSDGLAYNCYQHSRIQSDLAGKLETKIKPLMAQLESMKAA